jgi:thioredoxin 1
MSIIHLNSKNIGEFASGDKIVLIDCWAEWCGACQEFDPVFKKVAEKFPAHTFAKLDTVAEKELVAKLGIEHTPTLILFRGEYLLFQQPGYFEEEKLEDIIKQAESVDMDEVRSHFEAEKNQSDD